MDGFLQDNDDEQITVNDLIDLMNDFMADSESTAYGHTHMKARLKEHFGDQILITEINGKSNGVTFRCTAETTLQEFHARQNHHPEEEKKHIIKAAAKLIKNDIKLVEPSTENYPPVAKIETEEKCLNFVSDSLELLLEEILVGKDVGLKLASIGQPLCKQPDRESYLHQFKLDWVYNFIIILHHASSSTPFAATGSVVRIKKCKGLETMPVLIKELIYPTILPSLSSMSQKMLITT